MSAPRMPDAFASACWPAERLEEAVAALARRRTARVHPTASAPALLRGVVDADALGHALPTVAARSGLDAYELRCRYPELDSRLGGAAPAVVLLAEGDAPRLLLVTGSRGARLRVLAPDGAVRDVERSAVHAALCARWEEPLAAGIAPLLARLDVAPAERARVGRALLTEQLNAIDIGGLWTLRPSPARALPELAAAHGLPQRLALLVAAHAAQYALWLWGWATIGHGALTGDLGPRTLARWGALLLALLPLRLFVSWIEGRISIAAGTLLKERLMLGAVRLDPADVRHLGAGAHLGRVIESEAVELLGLSGGLTALLAVIELAAAAWVLAHGAAPRVHLALLTLWLAAMGLLASRLYAARARWTDSRLRATAELVERMSGHETRLAQQAPAHWHDGEDELLARYLADSRAFDRIESLWSVLPGRGWMVLGIAGLAGAIGAAPDAAPVAIALGGVLVGYQAFARLAAGLSNLVGAGISWQQVATLFRAAANPELLGTPPADIGPVAAAAPDAAPLLEADDVSFRHERGRAPVLVRIGFRIAPGDRVLLEGASGSGKSTLVSLLSGLRRPETGTLRLAGLGLETLGRDGWRRRVATAPQFHENHVFTGSLAFNVLMARRWPPRPEDVVEAEQVCRALGLGDLLDRMPGGIHQAVGETGWQLSHGERNRVYLARALAQGGALLVLDESFGALDPATLRRSIRHVLGLDRAVVVVGHFP